MAAIYQLLPPFLLLAIDHANLEFKAKFCVIARKQKIISVMLCATKVKEIVEDIIINFIQR